MKVRLIFLILLGAISFSSCTDDLRSDVEIWEDDYNTIMAHLAESGIPNIEIDYVKGYGVFIHRRYISHKNHPDVHPLILPADTNVYQYVNINYKIMTLDDVIVKESKSDTISEEVTMNGLLKGMQIGLYNMQEGDSATLYIPSVYGFGRMEQPNLPASTPIKVDIFLESHEIR